MTRTEKRASPVPSFPAGYLAAAVLATAVVLFSVAGQLKDVYSISEERHSEHYGALESANKVIILDAKLTMAAGLGAATGAAVHREEHERLAFQADSEIKALSRYVSGDAALAHIARVNEANLLLLELERRALRHGAEKRYRQGADLLTGEEYSAAKKAYSRGVVGLLNEMEKGHAAAHSDWRRRVLVNGFIGTAASGSALFFWIFFFLRLYDWLRLKGSPEEQLARKEEEFRHFFNTVQEIFYRADWKGRLVDITPSIQRYSGYTREELLGMPIANLYAVPETRKLLLKALLAKGMVEDYEVRLKTKDRGTLDVLVNARLLKGFGGMPLGVEGSLRDITPRKAAEKKLVRLNRLYNILSRVNEVIVRVKDPRKLLAEVCRIAVESGSIKLAWAGEAGPDGVLRPSVHHGQGETYLRGLAIPLSPARPEAKGPTARALLEKKVAVNSDSAKNPEVEPWREALLREGFLSSAAFPAADGVINFYSGEAGFFSEEEERLLWSLSEDVTFALNSMAGERARLEAEAQLEHAREQLRQGQKMEAVGRLAGGIAHDFNNMLTAILSYAGFLRNSIEASDPRRSDVEEIFSAAEKAAKLTGQLLAFSRRQMLLPRVISLNETVRGMDGLLRRLIGENIALEVRLDEGLRRVKADPGQVEQVIMNLALNAKDAISGQGRVIIETGQVELAEDAPGRHDLIPPGRYARLTVSDTGRGMSADVMSHIFEPFYTTKESGKGTGLGLATVYGIVKQSGGYIWVYSEPGGGTSFKVYFPEVSEAGGEVADREPRPAPTGGNETILLVEDETQVRAALARILRERGYSVLEASNGVEALGLPPAAIGSADLLMTDLMMPGMGGIELAAAVKSRRPALPILYISGYSEQLVAARENLGADSLFVQKPVDSSAMLLAVRKLLDRAKK